jgi:hypothetical protein
VLTELVPTDTPRTDLRNRPIRLTIEGEEIAAYGWGGRRAAVPRADIGQLGAYLDIEHGSRGGRWTYSSVLILDKDGRVLVRLTGHWDPKRADRFARGIGVRPLLGMYRLRMIRKQLRNRAPGYRKIRARSRLISLWFTLSSVLFLIVPFVLDAVFGDRWGTAAGIGGYLFWYLVTFRIPRWTRTLFRLFGTRETASQ